MVFHTSLVRQQGLYRYNPVQLHAGGPVRLFPYQGEDGTVRYILTQLHHNLISQGCLSSPLSLMLEQTEKLLEKAGEVWDLAGTLGADLKVFQSDWLNFTLPPEEQFHSEYVVQRREIGSIVRAAGQQARFAESSEQARLLFYQTLDQHEQAKPQIIEIHERDGGLSDREFARQRVAGPNPMVLRSLNASDQPKLQAWSAALSENQPKKTALDLSEAAAQNRLFVVDYPLFQDLTAANLEINTYVGNPQTLLYRSDVGLTPVLIQLEQGGTVLTPTSAADDWMRAKLYVQVADATHHELFAHLCYTHLAMEAIAIATPRQLPPTHPLYRLLRPHFQFLLAINTRGNRLLLGESGAVEQLLAPTLDTCIDLMNRAYRERSFQDSALPRDIQNRGISAEHLPDFPYRDDAQLLWDAIARYVTRYLKRYYRDDADILRDRNLQNWAAELGEPLNARPVSEFPQAPNWVPSEWLDRTQLNVADRPNHPRIPDFPTRETPGQFTTLQQLIEAVTQIIFVCGPQHAAVNFSQFDYFGYVPNSPLAAYARPDTQPSLTQLLPELEQEIVQMELTFALSRIRWGHFADSKLMEFVDAGDRDILQKLQSDLQSIEHEIQRRNHQRLRRDGIAYPYLLPSQIPNSINI